MTGLRPRSLTTKLLLIVVLCWILPLVVMGGYSVFFYHNSINSRINEYLSRQYAYCGQFTAERLDSVVTASKNASYDMTIERAYDLYQATDSWSTLFRSVDGYLRVKYFLNKRFLLSAFFLAEDDGQMVLSARGGSEEEQFYLQNVHAKAVERSKNIDTGVDFIIEDNRIFLVRNLMRVNGPVQRIGVLVLQLDVPYLLGQYYQQSERPVALAVSLGQGETYLAGSGSQELNAQLVQALPSVNAERAEVGLNNILFYHTIPCDGYTLKSAVALDKLEIYSRYDSLKNILSIIAMLLVPIIAGVVLFMYQNINRPIHRLIQFTKKIEQGSFGVVVEGISEGNHEFHQLAQSFNSMSTELQRLFETVYQEQLALRDARILALQSQINPHFLNNTLELMNWQARMAGDTEVSRMIEALSTLMDAGMDRSEARLVALSEELRYIDAYLYINSMRFGKRINIEKEIDRSLMGCAVPRLILQPLVENAVVHGIEPAQGGTVLIRIQRQGEDLLIHIRNNGARITDAELARVNGLLQGQHPPQGGSKSLGLRNINQRIGLIYGPSRGLRIFRDVDGWTVSELCLPAQELPLPDTGKIRL